MAIALTPPPADERDEQDEQAEREALKRQVEIYLRRLKIKGTLQGYRYLIYAIAKTIRDPDATLWIAKALYHDIAKQYSTTVSCVERNIRTAIQYSWLYANDTLDKMAGYHLTQRPTNGEFIDLVAAYIQRNG